MKKGFTLLELLIVMIIIAVLVAIGLPRYGDAINKAKKAEAVGTLYEIYKIEQSYYSVNGSYMDADTSLNSELLSVDMDGDGTADASLAVPNSANFTYSITAAAAVATPSSGTTYTLTFATGTVTES